MKKESANIKPLVEFFLFFFGLIAVCIVGITGVFADTYTYDQFTAQLYDNYGPTLSGVTTSQSNNSWRGAIPTMTANTSGAAWGISSPLVLLANHTYTLTAQITGTYGGSIVLSTYNRIGVGTTLSNAVSSYQNNTYVTENYSRVLSDGMTVQFAFTPSTNGSYIIFPFATNYTGSNQYFYLTNVVIDDLGNSGVSQSQITSSLDSQTTEINTSIQNSTNTITDALTETEESINGTINDINTTCGYQFSEEITYSDKSQTSANNEYLNSNGLVSIHNTLDSIGITDYKRIFSGTYLVSANNNGLMFNWVAVAFYDKDKNVIYTQSLGTNLPSTITLPDNVYYFRATVRNNGYTLSLVSQDSICVPNSFIEQQQNQETNDKLDETNDKLGDLNNNLTDSSPTDMSGLGDSAGWLPAGPVDSILTLPLTMLNSLVTNLTNNSCQTMAIELPFVKENLILPCVRSLYDKMGVTGTLFTTAGLIASAFILFNYLLALYKWVDDTLTMRENTMPGYFDDNWGGGA